MLNYIINNISKYNYSLYIPNQIKNNIYISITKIIPNSLINYNKKQDRYELLFNAENVINIKTFLIKNKKLNYKQVILLIKSITKQIEILENINYSFLGFDINDILVINKTYFIIVSTKYLLEIDNNKMIYLNPIKYPLFKNPEILNIKKIPEEIHIKVCYYSLGLLILYCMNKTLNDIYNTSIYWFLIRCFNKNLDKRVFLLL